MTSFSCRGNSSLHRRDFLTVGAAGLAGLSLGHFLQQRAWADEMTAKAKNVIMIFLAGGPSTIDMWDMKPAAKQNIRGEFKPQETSASSIQICELLPMLAKQMHLATLVRSVAHSIPEHTQGASYLMTGNRPNPAFEFPSLGSLSGRVLKSNRGVPTAMAVGAVPSSGAGELGSSLNPFEFSVFNRRMANGSTGATGAIGLPTGFTVTDLDRRHRVLERIERRMQALETAPLTQQLGQFQSEAVDILRSNKINQALDVDLEAESIRKNYGEGFLGRSALAARRLVEAGARFVTIGHSDWDTHLNNFPRMRNILLPELDRALGSLLEDLHGRGLLSETIVYCAGEFGRTPTVNESAGRDHWSRAMSVLLAGGGFRQGFVYGATDDDGNDPTDHACSPDDVSASIFHQLGFPPSHSVVAQSGRPFPIFRNGNVLHGILS